MNPQSIPPRRVSGSIMANSHAASPSPIVSPTAARPIDTEAPFSPHGTISPLTSLSPVSAPPMIHSKLYREEARSKPKKASATLKLSDPELKTVRSHAELAQTANGVRMLAKNLTRATIQLDVRSIMIVTKAKDNLLVVLTRELVEWLLGQSRDIAVYVDKGLEKLKRFNAREIFESLEKAQRNLRFWDKQFAMRNPEIFDLVLTLGGDGTVLYVLNLFQRIVPPVISFALGSLGFLTNFQFEEFPKHMVKVLERGVRANLRMRFTCRVHHADGRLVSEQQVLNELVVDRGPSPYVTQLELYGDGSLLTVAQADGLIIATPTGSTAYSLSAGGLLVHPGVSAISVTPICPHTLSFRPILLPDGMVLKVRVPLTSRLTAWASFDGKERLELKRGDYVTIRASPYPFPTVILSKTEYIDSVSRNLHWNVRDLQKPFTHLLSAKNKQLFEGGHGDAQFDIDYSDENDDELGTADTEITGSEPSEVEYDDDRPCFAHPNAKITLDHQ